MKLPGLRCRLCRITEIRRGATICEACEALTHKWNRKLYSTTPVISGREYITRQR